MRPFIFQLLVAIIPMLCVALAETTGQDSITCELELTDNVYLSEEDFEATVGVEDEWNCIDDSNDIYDLDGGWKRIFDEFVVRSGVTTLKFQNVTVRPEPDPPYGLPTIVVYNSSKIEHFREDGNGRKLLVPTSGELEVLVVRITDASGAQPRLNATEISDRILANSGDVESLKTQFGGCSGDQLNLTASTRNSDIVDGVLELSIDVNVADFDNSLRKSLEKVINRKLSSEGYYVRSFGLVLYIMPESTNLGENNVLGYAYVGGVKSVYKGVPSFQTVMHEIGHNLGLSHSGLEDASSAFYREYGDTTCQMGYSIGLNYYDYPQKCFNGVKSYDIGWYNQLKVGHEDIDIQSSWRGKLVGVHDYYGEQYDGVGCEGHRVIAKIGSLYMLFNRAENVTKDVHEFNKVTVTEKVVINGKDYSKQKKGGVLSKNDISTFETISGEIITVMVCDISLDDTNHGIMDYADVIIFRNDDNESVVKSCDIESPTNACPNASPLPSASPYTSPTASPSASATTSPIANPSSGPTASPSSSPTASLSSGPTASPTASLSSDPTASPTASPTTSLSSGPTASPTASLSSGPTATPTASPTTILSSGPTASPTAIPTTSLSSGPTATPTASPTTSLSSGPTASPTASPTTSLSSGPTASPTTSLSSGPTASPTNSLSSGPTASPTASPTTSLSSGPTASPTTSLSSGPTANPTASPTTSLSSGPTAGPTASPSQLRGHTPPECTPSEAILISNDRDTMFNEGTLPIRITSQNTTSVNFEFVNTFGATLTSVFTLFNTGSFGHVECLEKNNIQSLSTADEYLAICMGDDPHTIVNIWVEDGGREILNEGDSDIVPKCCHQSEASQELKSPIAMYTFKLSCINPCTVIGTMEQ